MPRIPPAALTTVVRLITAAESIISHLWVYSTGYSAPGVEKVVKDVFDSDELKKRRAQAPDVKESFECGREDDPHMPNIWFPDGVLPGFKETCTEFYWVCAT